MSRIGATSGQHVHRLRYGAVYHGLLIAGFLASSLVIAGLALGWFGLLGRDLPAPLDMLFEPSAWILLPVLLAWLVFSSLWVLRSVPTEVVIDERGGLLRCPLHEQRWSTGEELFVSVSRLGALVAAGGKSHVLPPIYEDWDELRAALRERATPFGNRGE